MGFKRQRDRMSIVGMRERLKVISDGYMPLFYKYIMKSIPMKSSVLDLGCGDGWLLETIKTHKKAKAKGIEISEEGVRKCIERGLIVYQGDIDEGLQDYPEDSFDVVLLLNTLPLLKKPDIVIKEMVRVGERAIVSFQNAAFIFDRLGFLFAGSLRFSMYVGQDWWNSEVIHPVSFRQFEDFCKKISIKIAKKYVFVKGRKVALPISMANLFCEEGVFILEDGD